MKRPAWATVVGILGIIFSCLGILGAGQEMMMLKMMDFQKDMFSAVMEQEAAERAAQRKADSAPSPGGQPLPDDNETALPPGPPVEIFKMMQKMWEVPEWYRTWSVVGGMLKLVICGLYLYASISLLQTKPFSVPLFYGAAGSSIALGVVKGVLAVSGASFIVMAMMFGGIFGIVIDIVLLVVVVTGDKRAFSPENRWAAPPTGPPPLPL